MEQQQQTNQTDETAEDGDQFVNDCKHYRIFGDYVRAWYQYNRKKNYVNRRKISELTGMTREELYDVIDELCEGQEETYHAFEQLVEAYYNSISGQTLTKPYNPQPPEKVERQAKRHGEDDSMIKRICNWFGG